MPWNGRFLLLGIVIPMVLFSHFSYGRDMQKGASCITALTGAQSNQSPESRLNKSVSRVSYDNTNWLSQLLREEFTAAPAPQQRGMDNITDKNLRRWTDDSRLMVMIIDPNVDAHKYVRDSNHRAKPSYLKNCKSISDGPEHARGLVSCHRNLFASEQEWLNTIEDLSRRNLHVDTADNHYLVYSMVNGEKKYFFSDMDLFAVFKVSTKGARPYFNNRLINQMNRVSQLPPDRGFQHGPRQDYQGKAQLGFKFPITAYVPGIEQPIHIRGVCELEKFYRIVNLKLEDIWGDFFAREKKTLGQFCAGK